MNWVFWAEAACLHVPIRVFWPLEQSARHKSFAVSEYNLPDHCFNLGDNKQFGAVVLRSCQLFVNSRCPTFLGWEFCYKPKGAYRALCEKLPPAGVQ
jgi:hypothetical protein